MPVRVAGAGSGRFLRVLEGCAKFRKVPVQGQVQVQVLEHSGRFRRVACKARCRWQGASFGGFRRVPVQVAGAGGRCRLSRFDTEKSLCT